MGCGIITKLIKVQYNLVPREEADHRVFFLWRSRRIEWDCGEMDVVVGRWGERITITMIGPGSTSHTQGRVVGHRASVASRTLYTRRSTSVRLPGQTSTHYCCL